MTREQDDFDPFLNYSEPLTPADAAAAILTLDDGRYLMQLRDNKPEIFFPGHWSCFGGAIEPGETEEAAFRREIFEELGLVVGDGEARYFSRMSFDFGFAGHGSILRVFFQVTINEEQAAGLKIHEGQELKAFDANSLLHLPNVAPYDRFALWMHASQERLASRPKVAVGASQPPVN